jgi:hypothetical protein
MEDTDEILAQACTAGGSRALPYQQMLSVLEAGHVAGLVLFTVDVTTPNQARPLPQWMFRLTDEELETVSPVQTVLLALEYYRQHSTDTELTAAWFEVYFEPPE